ncbi:unnamed protein product [Linum tenue]|uniref:Cytochrome c oxidase subunit 6b-1 n=1 Tax=Linum tenue TaxID=586396 RepID=A0AAV0ITI5_9ROSI|nr:unnamed protein product [Linum tenue]CAI0549235.1 unnamed protein product [Linum tenue]
MQQYLLKEKEEKPVVDAKPVEVKEELAPAPAVSEESVAEKAVEIGEAVVEKAVEITDAVTESKTEDTPAATEESTENIPAAAETTSEDVPPASSEQNSGTEEVAEEAPEIKLETAPADFRFPTTNQTRHCFTRYIEYHRCVAAKGEDAQDCQKFAKYYRSLCPSEWVDRWNEQRENGTFPGPL